MGSARGVFNLAGECGITLVAASARDSLCRCALPGSTAKPRNADGGQDFDHHPGLWNPARPPDYFGDRVVRCYSVRKNFSRESAGLGAGRKTDVLAKRRTSN